MYGLSCILDVTRTKINKPRQDQAFYYSMKDRFHALKYELAVNSEPPYHIIWMSGPHYGSQADITIAREEFLTLLHPDEFALADLGYQGEAQFITPFRERPNMDQNQIVHNEKVHRLRQVIEQMNSRVKIFEVCREWKRQDYADWHGQCFRVVCKITNILLVRNPLIC